MSKVNDIVTLLDKGFRPYSEPVPEEFYRERRCHTPKKAEWFVRPWSQEHKCTRYLCLGCVKRCAAVDPVGFQIMLPIKKKRLSAVMYAPMRPLTVDQLLDAKKVLRADEAAWALNLSRNAIYDMVQDGRLDAVTGLPVRVTVESVRRCLEPLVS